MKIDNEVANILGISKMEGNKLFLPGIQLDRKVYLSVNKVLEAIGGKWNRKAKAHIFENDPANIVEEILLSGEYTNAKKEYQFFETPPELARRLVDMAEIQPRDTILEPSAGRGAIAKYINVEFSCDCIELNPENRKYLLENGFYLVGDDFLQCRQMYDVIIANPPFTQQQDIEHVNHMITLSRRVVSVMSASTLWRENKKTKEFRQLIADMGGIIESLPDDSFKESGTRIKTCVVCIDVK